jgi:hypothetical protein
MLFQPSVMALRKNPVHNNPECKNTETRKNPEHIHKSRNPDWSLKGSILPSPNLAGEGERLYWHPILT